MGLDMYLHAKRYIAGWASEEEAALAREIQKLFPELEGRTNRLNESAGVVKEIIIEVGYWRKANAIHDWFVRNVQDGEDDCLAYRVSREHLQELKILCDTVLADPTRAEELLPTASGFFFGGVDYDEYYLDNLRYTTEIIDHCLRMPPSWEFEYRSSW